MKDTSAGSESDSTSAGRLSPFFFFSSRRRHTRWTGDWSSDVCSSDLPGGAILLPPFPSLLGWNLPLSPECLQPGAEFDREVDQKGFPQSGPPLFPIRAVPDRKSVV